MKTSKHKVLIITLIATIGIGGYFLLRANADSLTAEIDVIDGCKSSINGSSSRTVNVVAGNNTLLVTNYNMINEQSVSGPGVPAGTKAGRNTKTTDSRVNIDLGSITSPTTITFTPIPNDINDPGSNINYCPLGSSPSSSYLVINPVVAPAPVSTPTTSTKKLTSAAAAPTTSTPAATSPTTTPTKKETTNKQTPKLQNTGSVSKPSVPISNRTAIIVTVLAALTLGAFIAYLLKCKPKNKFLKSLQRKLK